ncbi:probable insulin-like peptide 5 [Eupeodes corollae]|uniref:probable insulin-like peptide 5 n=1 Tax=Eupeodes corollae TaxID=290404 RepID=UPI002493A3F8|nr:probable insulin-like peptide 5 [Eupeodes corollae]
MTFSKMYSFIGALLLFVVCLATIDLTVGEQRICGHKLREVMDMVCPNGFQGYKTKRSSSSIDEELIEDKMGEDFNFGLSLDMLPFLTSMENNGLTQIRRRRHGVAHECCDKPCKISEIQAYCRF